LEYNNLLLRQLTQPKSSLSTITLRIKSQHEFQR
jgi:hypothetical protein